MGHLWELVGHKPVGGIEGGTFRSAEAGIESNEYPTLPISGKPEET